jgi:hypothetical protein
MSIIEIKGEINKEIKKETTKHKQEKERKAEEEACQLSYENIGHQDIVNLSCGAGPHIYTTNALQSFQFSENLRQPAFMQYLIKVIIAF